MGEAGKRLVKFLTFKPVQLGGGQWLENKAKENPH
tara:strand:+ start:392 stop:496 length:105 start_codon:yes stop_codon:yes gene_type:complete